MKNCLYFLLALGLLVGCRRDTPEPIPEPDPCADRQPIAADFLMEQTFRAILDSRTEFFDESGDTILAGAISFRALQDSLTYEWHIGDDDRVFTEQVVTLFFDAEFIGLEIPVTLIVRGRPDPCFPGQTLVHQQTRRLYISNTCQSKVIGEWEGRREGETDIFTVKLNVMPDPMSPGQCWGVAVENMAKDGCRDELYNAYSILGHRVGYFAATSIDCQEPRGVARLIGDDSIRIEYSLYNRELSTNRDIVRDYYVFTGKRK